MRVLPNDRGVDVEVSQFFPAPVRASSVVLPIPSQDLPDRFTVLSGLSHSAESNVCAMARGGHKTAWTGDVIVVKHVAGHPSMLMDIKEEEIEGLYQTIVGLGKL